MRVGQHQVDLLLKLRSLSFIPLYPRQRDAGWNAIVRDQHKNPFRGFAVVTYPGHGRYIGYLSGGVPHGTGVKVMQGEPTDEGEPRILCQAGHFKDGVFCQTWMIRDGDRLLPARTIRLPGKIRIMRDEACASVWCQVQCRTWHQILMGCIPTAFTTGGCILERVSLAEFEKITRAFEQGPHTDQIWEILPFADREWNCAVPAEPEPTWNMRLRIILALAQQRQRDGQQVTMKDVRCLVVASETPMRQSTADERKLTGLILPTIYDVEFNNTLDHCRASDGEGFCQ